MKPCNLTCEYTTNPLGIETPQPRLGWQLQSSRRGAMQQAYRILVASTSAKLDADQGDLWDSGRVESDQFVNIPYAGATLVSAQRCWWKVCVCDDAGETWSEPARFEMGLLSASDWQGTWIAADASVSSPLLRRAFALKGQIVRARAYMSGLGWSELYINGRRVGDNVLDPATSEYHKRAYYVTHDVTDILSSGANAIGVMLGNGWFSEPDWETRACIRDETYGTPGFTRAWDDSRPVLMFQINIELADGSTVHVSSDGSWKVSPGPITRNNFWEGEIYDARAEQSGWNAAGFDDSAWAAAQVVPGPGGKLVSQIMPPIKVTRTLRPARFTIAGEGVYVYDMGELFGGWVRIRVKGPAGTKIIIRYGARLDDATGLPQSPGGPDAATDYYIMKGDAAGEQYEPRFTNHGVQYVSVEGCPQEMTIRDVDGRVVHSAVDMTGEFSCSNPLVTTIHNNVVRTLTNDLLGLPLDCLYREHWAWTDPATITGSLYPRKCMPQFWTKWLEDIRDAQRPDGAVPNVCPNYRGDASDPAWGGNYPLLVWYLHQYYSDERILADHYDAMKRCVDYLTSVAQDHIVTKGQFGDHMLPGDAPGKEEFISSETPREMVWTGYYYRAALVVAQAAEELGNAADCDRYGMLAAAVAEAINAKWFDRAAGSYCGGVQTANAFALVLDIVPQGARQSVIDAIVANIARHGGHLHAGNTGTTCLIDTLTAAGQGELLYKVLNDKTYPGWGYMVANGATTIWESWSLSAQCGNVESMIMWATIDQFFYNDLAGIKAPSYYGPTYHPRAFTDVRIEPLMPEGLDNVRATMQTVHGRIGSEWFKWGTSRYHNIEIPAGTHGTFSVPKLNEDFQITESSKVVYKDGAFVPGVEGVLGATDEGGRIALRLGGGWYAFGITPVKQ
ncbi:MAG: family 78 glycoside hydrolase catalytic domain [Planctomycetaceae bacterium]|nr:glycoside hydrolase family 78 protein [Planctomycetaceae bacterium]